MKLTVIREDGAIYLDGVSYDHLDMTGVPAEVHALQWKETSGWIEFTESTDGAKQANAPITELPQWALNCIILWDAANVSAKAAAAAAIPVSIPVAIL